MRRYRRVLPFALATVATLANLRGQSAPEEEFSFAVPNAVARAINSEYRALLDRRRQLEATLAHLPAAPNNERALRIGWKVFGYDNAFTAEQWVEIDLGSVQPIDSVGLVPIDMPSGNSTAPGHGFPQRFRLELMDASGHRTAIIDRTDRDFPNPGSYPVLLPTPGAAAQRVRVFMNKPWIKGHYRGYALSEVMILRGNRNLATGLSGVKVRASGSFEHGPAWSRDNLIDGESIAGAPIERTERPQTHGWQSDAFVDATTPVWAQLDLGRVRALDEIRLLPVKYPEFSSTQGYGFPARVQVEVANDATFAAPQLVAEWSSHAFGTPAFSPITIPARGATGRFVRVTARELWAREPGQFICALAEMQVYAGDANVALGAPVTVSSAAQNQKLFDPRFLTDGQRGLMDLTEWPAWLAQLSRRREAQLELEEVERRLAKFQPTLASEISRAAAVIAAFFALAILGTFIQLRRKQARAVAALQRRIAGDLHDEIGSNLASIAMLAELGHREPTGPRAANVEEIRQLAADSAAAMRDIVWLTQPGPHDVPQLTERLRDAAQRLLKGVEWSFEIEGLTEAPTLDVQRHLLLALKEMLNNVLRHSGAGRVRIRLAVEDRHFVLEVEDDGRGFVVDRRSSGHGLTSLRHRSTLLHGALELASQPGHGTRISLRGLLRPAAATV